MVNWFYKKHKDNPYEMYDFGGTIATAGYCIFVVLFAIGGISHLLDVWNWAAFISPKLAMAHKLLGL